jgi:hypothetical protein
MLLLQQRSHLLHWKLPLISGQTQARVGFSQKNPQVYHLCLHHLQELSATSGQTQGRLGALLMLLRQQLLLAQVPAQRVHHPTSAKHLMHINSACRLPTGCDTCKMEGQVGQ